jgi:hypothetical protein
MDKLLTIGEVLKQNQEYAGWFYLPNQPWNLQTKGVFVRRDKDADPNDESHIPKIAKENSWIPTLDAPCIEDIIFNAEDQIEHPTEDDLFRAFIFYFENDAFIDFNEH